MSQPHRHAFAHSFYVRVAFPPEGLDDLHEKIEEGLSALHVRDPVLAARMETAIIEVHGNILRLRQTDEPTECHLTLGISLDGGLVACLADDNVPLTADLEGPVMPDEDTESGRGLALTRTPVDTFSYERVNEWNIWHLTVGAPTH